MENINNIIKRIDKLEEAVFNKKTNVITNIKTSSSNDFEYLFKETIKEFDTKLLNIKSNFKKEDSIIFQATICNNEKHGNYHLTSLFTLDEEEPDEELELLCNVLSSKQRISILRNLTKNKYSSGELVKITNMAGGHLHHHLKELLNKNFICKTEKGKYTATNLGINVYLTISALNRRINYSDR